MCTDMMQPIVHIASGCTGEYTVQNTPSVIRSNVVASYIHHYRAFPVIMVLRYVDIVAISQHRRHSRNKELPLYCAKN
jgi:hypothetical protein